MSHRVLEMICSTFTFPESPSVLPRQGDTAQFSANITHTHDLRRPSVWFYVLSPEGALLVRNQTGTYKRHLNMIIEVLKGSQE